MSNNFSKCVNGMTGSGMSFWASQINYEKLMRVGRKTNAHMIIKSSKPAYPTPRKSKKIN